MRGVSVVVLLTLAVASGHLSVWNKGTYDCGYPDPNSDRPVWPLWQTDKWWWHSALDCKPNGTQSIPSGGSLALEFSSNKAHTSMGQGLLANPTQRPNPWPTGAVTAWGNLHASVYPDDIMGCALAIAYKSDRYSVTPKDFIVFSVVQDCPTKQLQTFQIPQMPACPSGGCQCTWVWVNKYHQSYMSPFACNVTNPNARLSVPTPQVPTDCTNGGSCVSGAKTPLFYGTPTQSFAPLVPIRDTIFQLSPRYKSTWGFNEGAQSVFPSRARAAAAVEKVEKEVYAFKPNSPSRIDVSVGPQMVGFDNPGGDIDNGYLTNVASANDCQTQCVNRTPALTGQCYAWSWNTQSKECWLKGVAFNPVSNPNMIAGTVNRVWVA
ncbi:hypothetical protein PROFUN_07245 [Planoprotostelium fungivorum]|uniref:Apple domain-containing protein n=1 Tax=Planoprotostelium fungivorum TaxID=1890364 RepID=A0A2P6NM69_9EUKA|nr:hypothetical protein PROFUN_07245 [Planoprotostelium fungivorum]